MGSIFKYSGLTTKVRAMRGGLIKREQYAKIAGLGSVGEMTFRAVSRAISSRLRWRS